MKSSTRKFIILIGDWAGLYLSLFLMVFIRYGDLWYKNWQIHLLPFSILFPLWIVALYGNYLYETRFFRFGIETLKAIGSAIAIALIASISAFYIFPPGLIYPRRNMVIFAVIYAVVLGLWRFGLYKILKTSIKTNLIFIGSGPEIDELEAYFKKHPHLGYNTIDVIEKLPKDITEIRKKINENNIRLIVVKSPKNDESFAERLFSLLSKNITAIGLERFYERVLYKVSPEILTDTWFIQNLENINLEIYRTIKRLADIFIATVGLLICALVYPFIALAIRLDSRGPILFKQKRVGVNDRLFSIYKFRTMRALMPGGSAETSGAQWAMPNDSRITRIGKFLRKTRMDELPQLWNVLIGEMSFVGPRPERPEFMKELTKRIPYYGMRHLIRPGITGWAQINYEYGDSVEDARIKLQYDIYYVRRRSIILDIAIILKTVKILITRQGQ